MNIKVVDDTGEEIQNNTSDETRENESEVSVTGRLLEDQVAQIFDLKPSELGQYRDKLRVLIEYAKSKTDDHSPDGIKWALRSLGVKLGTPPLGEKLINYLHIYAKLHLQGQRIDQEKQKYLRGE